MSKTEKEDILLRIDNALVDIRPHLKVDGGDIEIMEVTDDFDVKVKWLGNCEFCSMSAMTLKAGVEQAIMSKVPEIRSVEAVNGVA